MAIPLAKQEAQTHWHGAVPTYHDCRWGEIVKKGR